MLGDLKCFGLVAESLNGNPLTPSSISTTTSSSTPKSTNKESVPMPRLQSSTVFVNLEISSSIFNRLLQSSTVFFILQPIKQLIHRSIDSLTHVRRGSHPHGARAFRINHRNPGRKPSDDVSDQYHYLVFNTKIAKQRVRSDALSLVDLSDHELKGIGRTSQVWKPF
ncbi:uncharacterized protein LOC130760116 isoform X2 [Actinidia eriantha]|uniref:uncharacterized protein LOC130760116 isoform X2 n=1 Tax=Actinidia eriantha TaxID=165200 RepID=UPI00258F22A3|nr:uncharacterized protein LOC130760116 isoform X2 [Actinidia eriantha]